MSALEIEPTTCTKCQRTKPLSEFSRKGDGYSSQCKECVAAYMREWSARRKADLEGDGVTPAPSEKPAPKPKTGPTAVVPKPKSKPKPPAGSRAAKAPVPAPEAPRIKSNNYVATKAPPALTMPRAIRVPLPPEPEESAETPTAQPETVYVERRIVLTVRVAVEVRDDDGARQ